MNLDSLLFSKDPALLGVLRQTLEKLSINIEVCSEGDACSDSLAKRKFDAVIIDCDDQPDGVTLLEGLRQTHSNAKAVAFAVLNGKTTTQEAFGYGANFVLQKPLTPLHATRCFHAAIDFMLRERRRYFRYPVEIPVQIAIGRNREVGANSTNVSESGIAIHATSRLDKDTVVALRFTLPDSDISLELKGDIVWADTVGRAGIRFVEVPKNSQYQLEKWLTERLQKEMPTQLQTYPALT
ncbi:MAG: PilZ domain-containing protein [Terriglobales bacterium]